MLPKQAKKNYLCSQIEKRKTMKHTNPQVEQMTSFIVMDVLERANELQKQGIDIIHLEVGEPDFDVPACVALIFLSVLLTGLNLYSKIGKFGGAGGLVPITGFANSVASSAIEFQAEGQIFGIGCKIFTIAGPVILYGILSSWLLGIVYYILKLMEVIG